MIKVIHSCDDNPHYLDFWPLVSKVWKKHIGITPVLIHLGKNKNISEEYGEVHYIPVNKSLPIHTQAQLARLWYPSQEPNTLWITSDIDMFPMSRSYWNEVFMNMSAYANLDWTNLGSDSDYFQTCYHIAKGKMFNTVLGIDPVSKGQHWKYSFYSYVEKVLDDIPDFCAAKEVWFSWCQDLAQTACRHHHIEFEKWNADELFSSKKIIEFRNGGGNVYQPQRTSEINIPVMIRRLERSNWNYNPALVKGGYYIDCHSLRPYSKYKDQIDKVLNLLPGMEDC